MEMFQVKAWFSSQKKNDELRPCFFWSFFLFVFSSSGFQVKDQKRSSLHKSQFSSSGPEILFTGREGVSFRTTCLRAVFYTLWDRAMTCVAWSRNRKIPSTHQWNTAWCRGTTSNLDYSCFNARIIYQSQKSSMN